MHFWKFTCDGFLSLLLELGKVEPKKKKNHNVKILNVVTTSYVFSSLQQMPGNLQDPKPNPDSHITAHHGMMVISSSEEYTAR